MKMRLHGLDWLDNAVRDVRFAARGLRRTPRFALLAITSLAIGLALSASTFAVMNAYLVRSLPYPAAERLFHVIYAPPGPWEPPGMSALDWQSVNDVVEFPVTSIGDTFYIADGGYTQSVRGLRGSPGFLAGLGVRVTVGRSLTQEDFRPSAERVALIGYSLWRDHFGSDLGVLGRTVRADAEVQGSTEIFRVVGVLPPDFYFGRDSIDKVDLLVPLTTRARTYMVRLREGVPVAVAERRITEAAIAVTSGVPPDWTGVHLEAVRDRYVAQIRPVLRGVGLAVGLVLFIVCANVAVLVLLRTMRRQKEMAVRLALGSDRWHIVRMLLAETMLLCAAALGVGLVLTNIALDALAPVVERQLGRAAPGGTSAIGLDSTVVAVIGSIGIVIAFGLAFLPLLTPWQRRLADTLGRDGRTSTDGRSASRLRSALIAVEVAGSLVLLVGCGMTIRTVVGMVQSDLGFETERLVRSRVVLRARNYPDGASFTRFYDQFATRLSTIANSPVVFTSWPPFSETPKVVVETELSGENRVNAGIARVSAGYFSMLGIGIQQGRSFTTSDHLPGAAPVAVISATTARRFWPDGSAVGQQVRAVEPTPKGPTPGVWRTVVGVASDARQTYTDADLNDFYVPFFPEGRFGSFYLQTDRPEAQLLGTLRAVTAEIDADAVVDRPRVVEDENRQLAGAKFLTSLLTGFAAIATFLAIVGIYGVTAFVVQQREREVAIRMALGATGNSVIRIFLKSNGVMLAVGLAAGLLASLAAARFFQSQIYGAETLDASTLAAAFTLMAVVGVLATWWPALRAAKASSIMALKEH